MRREVVIAQVFGFDTREDIGELIEQTVMKYADKLKYRHTFVSARLSSLIQSEQFPTHFTYVIDVIEAEDPHQPPVYSERKLIRRDVYVIENRDMHKEIQECTEKTRELAERNRDLLVGLEVSVDPEGMYTAHGMFIFTVSATAYLAPPLSDRPMDERIPQVEPSYMVNSVDVIRKWEIARERQRLYPTPQPPWIPFPEKDNPPLHPFIRPQTKDDIF